MSETRHHAPQRKLLLLRLVYRRRQTPPQGPPNRTRRPPPPEPDAPDKLKPSGGRTVGQAVASLVATANYPRGGHLNLAAQALIAAAPQTALSDLGAAHISRTRQAWQALAAWTRYNRERALRHILADLHRQGALDLTPQFNGTPPPSPRQITPTGHELEALKACNDPALRWLILAASEAGLRSGTAYRCTIGDCAAMRIAARTKNQRLTDTPISPAIAELLATIDPLTPPDTRVVDALNHQPISQNALKRRWCLFRTKAGIRKQLRLHDLRRGLARAVYDTTGDLRQAQAILSHSNLTSTLMQLRLVRMAQPPGHRSQGRCHQTHQIARVGRRGNRRPPERARKPAKNGSQDPHPGPQTGHDPPLHRRGSTGRRHRPTHRTPRKRPALRSTDHDQRVPHHPGTPHPLPPTSRVQSTRESEAPMTLNTVETYMPQCEKCARCVIDLVAYAVNDPTLTSITLTAGKHCHATPEGRSGTPATIHAVAVGDANGFDVWTSPGIADRARKRAANIGGPPTPDQQTLPGLQLAEHCDQVRRGNP